MVRPYPIGVDKHIDWKTALHGCVEREFEYERN